MRPALLLGLVAAAAPAGAGGVDSLQARLQLRACASSVREEAVLRCRQALDLGLGPQRAVVAQGLLGRSLADLARWDEAERAYRAALALRPQDPDLALQLGLALHFGLNRSAEALPFVEQAAAGRPQDAVVQAQLATLLNALGRHDEARAAFQRALALDPDVLEYRPAAQAAYLASLREAFWP